MLLLLPARRWFRHARSGLSCVTALAVLIGQMGLPIVRSSAKEDILAAGCQCSPQLRASGQCCCTGSSELSSPFFGGDAPEGCHLLAVAVAQSSPAAAEQPGCSSMPQAAENDSCCTANADSCCSAKSEPEASNCCSTTLAPSKSGKTTGWKARCGCADDDATAIVRCADPRTIVAPGISVGVPHAAECLSAPLKFHPRNRPEPDVPPPRSVPVSDFA